MIRPITTFHVGCSVVLEHEILLKVCGPKGGTSGFYSLDPIQARVLRDNLSIALDELADVEARKS